MRQSVSLRPAVRSWIRADERYPDSRKLQKYDVVITSYPTCAGEWPGQKSKAGKKSAGVAAEDDDDDDGDGVGGNVKPAGPLFDPDHVFYRGTCSKPPGSTSMSCPEWADAGTSQSFSMRRTRSRITRRELTGRVELSGPVTVGA